MAEASDLIKKTAGAVLKRPVHEVVYHALREQILFGELAPGEAVTIQGLTTKLDAGMTPVREAIRRLTAEEALNFMGNRRVTVPGLTASDIDELILLRLAVEPELTRRACRAVTKGDIETLVSIDAALDSAIQAGDVPGYLRRNHAFHTAIYDFANAPILASTAQRLWLRFGPSLRVICGRFGTSSLPDFHKELLSALRSGDADGAAEAMANDVEQGMVQVRLALEQIGQKARLPAAD